MWSPDSLKARIGAPIAALLLSAFMTADARAAEYVDVFYDLRESRGVSIVTLPLIDGVRGTLGPEQFAGTQTLRYASDSASNAVGGPVHLVSFHLTVNVPVYPVSYTSASKLGTAAVHLQPLGTLSPVGSLLGRTLDPQGHSAIFEVTGSGHCSALCAALGSGVLMSVPLTLQPTTFARDFPALYAQNGAATVTGAEKMSFTLDPGDPSTSTWELVPVTLYVSLIGRELSRTPVGLDSEISNPEPGTLLLLGLGLAGLAGWSRAPRRQG